eukprot:gene1190-2315_t
MGPGGGWSCASFVGGRLCVGLCAFVTVGWVLVLMRVVESSEVVRFEVGKEGRVVRHLRWYLLVLKGVLLVDVGVYGRGC